MHISINAGHTERGAGYGTAFDGWHESKIARRIASELIVQLRRRGHKVSNSTVSKASSQNAYLRKACGLANASGAELFVSIHLNASPKHTGNGVEVYTWRGERLPQAVGICEELHRLGFRNRGVKDGSGLHVIKNTVIPALLIECFFMDNEIDRALYEAHGAAKIAEAIRKGLR